MSSTKSTKLPPTMTAPWTEPAPLADVPGGEPNLLHRSAWSDPDNPLKVMLQPWYDGDDPPGGPWTERVDVFLADDESNIIGSREWDLPMDPDDYYVPISADRLPSGTHTLSFIMTNFVDVPARSHPFTVTVDKSPPILAANSELIFPAEVLPPNHISAAYLADPENNDQVLATLPDYNEKMVGDVITWYWETSPGGLAVVDTKTLAEDDLSLPVQVAFSGDLLRRANGEFYATYRVRDRAGNGDDVLSSPERLTVNIRPPTPRRFPTVKEASNNGSTGVLEPFQGQSGVTVVVATAEIDPGEQVTVDFVGLGGEDGVGSVTGVQPITPGGLEFGIPASVVAANIPVNGDGRKVEVYYWAGQDTQPSAVYTLSINAFAAGALGRLVCLQAQVGSPATLSKAAVPARGADLEIAKWIYQDPAQLMKVWAIASGTRTDFLNGVPVEIDGKFTTVLPKDYVDQRPLNSTFTLYASVSFDRGHSYIAFRTLPLKVVA
ncbi:hypothetical protein [Pseudomonas sp. T1.Ur]|uniref:hypothetical protein n=1 Tax=Pseudomonas sp. T1.Ur TaxID=2928704 RepID=UPI00201E3197|nr:hypothetical protein [Pseudomonas sp. T1.Ur]MCL6703299.1 hypothetical protein [Pseudomonas sp. T1.Ur]